MIWKLQTTFSNLSSMKMFEFQLQFHWSLFPRVQLIISQHCMVQVMAWLRTGEKPLPESMLTQFTDAYIRHWGGNKITKSGRSFHWGLVHLVQSASLRWNSPKLFHTVFDTACRCQVITNIQYWLQIIDIHHLCDESNLINPRCGKISANFYISPPHPAHPQFYPQKMVEI